MPVSLREAPVWILSRCCSRGHIRLRAPYGLTRLHTFGLVELFARPHGYPVRCPHCFPYPMGSVRAVHGLFVMSKPVRGPFAYNACIRSLRVPYGEAKFVRRHTGPVRVPWVDVRFLFKTAREQPGARVCDVTEALIKAHLSLSEFYHFNNHDKTTSLFSFRGFDTMDISWQKIYQK